VVMVLVPSMNGPPPLAFRVVSRFAAAGEESATSARALAATAAAFSFGVLRGLRVGGRGIEF
jgi:hypothetical protein